MIETDFLSIAIIIIAYRCLIKIIKLLLRRNKL